MTDYSRSLNLFQALGYWSGAAFSSYDSAFPNLSLFDANEKIPQPEESAPTDVGQTCSVGESIKKIDPLMLKVRMAVCLVGFDWNLVQNMKSQVSSLVDKRTAFEAFHVRKPSDVKDGALLVPKVIVVVKHSPGQKLLDEKSNEGQLDYIYDEICETGADLLVIYTGLPKFVYKPIQHMVYHPRMIDLVFQESTILRKLAEEHSLITTVHGSTLNSMQKNAIAEWLQKPVYSSHPVFNGASRIFDQYFPIWMKDDTEFWSESEVTNQNRSKQHFGFSSSDVDTYQTAVEEHPLADKKRKSKRRLQKLKEKLKRKSNYETLVEVDDQERYRSQDQVELSMYSADSGMSLDTLHQIGL